MTKIELKDYKGNLFTVDDGLFINNEFVPATSNSTLITENPSTGQAIASVSAAQVEDVELAYQSSLKAFRGSWRSTQPAARGKLLDRLADLIERDAEHFIALEAIDAGILRADATNLHLPNTIATLRYFAGWADKITGLSMDTSMGFAYTRREPLGVCAAVTPWNAPLMIMIWKVAPAIAAGNTLIVKTPEAAPLVGQKLAALIIEAGFPPGVINILCGEGKIAGQALAEHGGVRKISFTGSTAVGRQIMKAAAGSNLKKASLELGGKGPSIVFADADMDNALFWTTLGFTANNGQVCVAGSRIYVQGAIYEQFLAKFQEKLAGPAAYGDALDPSTTKGPLINKAQHERVLGHIVRAKEEGVRLLLGGEALGDQGYFVANTVFADVSDDAATVREEVFGPVTAISKFTTEQEVIEKANALEYGLSAALFTNDISRAHRVSSAIEAGQVMINSWGTLDVNVPFGGIKQSGFGREFGEAALDDWTSVKAVKLNVLNTA